MKNLFLICVYLCLALLQNLFIPPVKANGEQADVQQGIDLADANVVNQEESLSDTEEDEESTEKGRSTDQNKKNTTEKAEGKRKNFKSKGYINNPQTPMDNFLYRRKQNIQRLTDQAQNQASEMIGYLKQPPANQLPDTFGERSGIWGGLSMGGPIATAALMSGGVLNLLSGGEELLKLANGIVSENICKKVCTRKQCSTPRVRALCRAKCGRNTKAMKACS